jgi:hypothetical protein
MQIDITSKQGFKPQLTKTASQHATYSINLYFFENFKAYFNYSLKPWRVEEPFLSSPR